MRPYVPVLDLRQTETAIREIKELFQRALVEALNLSRVSAPLFVRAGTGVNDDLNGVERPVSFEIPALGCRAEVVQSLAKWKRLALADYGFAPGEGLYTDMNAVRPDETPDETHSLYVDQWDWEAVIREDQRTLAHLERTARRIYGAVVSVERELCRRYPALEPSLPDELAVVHALELERMYPDLPRPERESRLCERHGAAFVVGIGAPLADGAPHDRRAPDYDDWITPTERGPGLNGDLLVWNRALGRALELSSMGIRVDAQALRLQLEAAGRGHHAALHYHRRLLAGELPFTIGGGIGQSRLCMQYLQKRHIGEVQCGLWPDDARARLAREGVALL
jgi:aspartate--ammonia ligase